MSNISRIDKNFAVETNIKKEDIVFYNADEAPFKIYGVFRENGKYRRMPEAVAKKVNEGVFQLHTNTAGGRVRFVTDSDYVAIHTKMDGLGKMPHFAFTGAIGFDLYSDDKYEGTFIPPFDVEDGFESVINFETKSNEPREITINFPLYSNVSQLYIGIQKNAVLKEASPYKNSKPIVYYGSSITQGGCASRPGMSYQSIISRKFNYDFINLGFSGSARAEYEIAEYIKNLDISIFVYDYDHNSPTVEHLEKTHEKMFKTIRKAHPNLPIIMMSRPKHYKDLDDFDKARFEIIKKTYINAKENGDENIYFISGDELMSFAGYDGRVDVSHPNDLGFMSMAKAICEILYDIHCV